MKQLFNNLTRKRQHIPAEKEQSQYVRCLTTLDLSSLGVASVVGAGLYVVIGKLARDVAGPAVVLSFALAALSALLSGLCYAKFGCRIPKAGSAYVYTYTALGELWAFITGWNMILEYVIGASSLGRACSEYIDSLSGGVIYTFFMKELGWWDSPAFGKFPDFLALLIVLFIAFIIGLGVKHSSIFNKVVTFINIVVIVFTFCVGSYYADTSNWSTWEKFAPYGFTGVITAAGSCFYAFVGFDVVGTAGEEAVNPKKAIPRAFIATIVVSFLSYFGVSTVLTLMQPYNQLNRFAPLAEAFAHKGFAAAKYVIAVGAVFATLGCLLSIAFAAPRIIHAMAADGLLFDWLSNINNKTHVPVRALLCSTTFIGILTVILDLEQLVEMLSIGTLIAYTLVAVSVLLTRYQCDVESVYDDSVEPTKDEDTNVATTTPSWLASLCCNTKDRNHEESSADYSKLRTSENGDNDVSQISGENEPTENSSFRASVATFILTIGLIVLCIMLSNAHSQIVSLKVWAVLVVCASGVIILGAVVFLHKQPMNSATFPFTVPFVPVLPILTLFINLLLIVNLNHWTYVRFSVWMVLG